MPDIFVSDEENSEKGDLDLEMKSTSQMDEPSVEASSVKHKHPVDHSKSTHRKPHEEHLRRSVGYRSGPLSAYCYYPTNLNFMNKDKEEIVVLLLRKHPLTNIPWIIIATLMLVAPAALEVVPILSFLPPNFQVLAILSWYLISLAFIFEQFLTWFFNVNIITDERIFDVDFHNLLYREITDAHLDQVQDVTVRVGSAIRTVFNYGDVLIQTAGEVPNIEFEAVPHPDRVAKILRELGVEEQIEKVEGRIR